MKEYLLMIVQIL